MDSHYDVLEVSPSASDKMIRLAYRELCRRHHPDHGGNAVDMARVAAAFATLSNPDSRMAYDAQLAGS